MGNGQTVLQFGAALVNAVTPKSFFFFFWCFLGRHWANPNISILINSEPDKPRYNP